MLGGDKLIGRMNSIASDVNGVIARTISEVVEGRKSEIKNIGSLNNDFYYFRVGNNDKMEIVRNSDAELSDQDKYYAVAADAIVFNNTRSHVLMEFRCPHRQGNCKNNVIDEGISFQYKGCLGTPGDFFHADADIDENGSPDFFKLAKRQITEQGISQSGAADKIEFIQATFNNYRDIRWKYSSNYVPTVALQFAVTLDHDNQRRTFFWRRYLRYLQTFKMMHNNQFNDMEFKNFVTSHFKFDSERQMPLNKRKHENGVLSGLSEMERVIDYNEQKKDKYHFNDFAFDHICNIIDAYKRLNSNILPDIRSPSVAKTPSLSPLKPLKQLLDIENTSGNSSETLSGLANPEIQKKLEETTISYFTAIAALVQENGNIRPWLAKLQSLEIPFETFLEKTGDIFSNQSLSGTDGFNWPGLNFFSSIIADVSSVSPILRLSVLLISTGYQIATASENYRNEIRELIIRFKNLVMDINALQETRTGFLDPFPKTKRLLLDRIDQLLTCLIYSADVCIRAKFTGNLPNSFIQAAKFTNFASEVWSAITDTTRVKNAYSSLQAAEDLLYAVKLNALVVGESKIDSSFDQLSKKVDEILLHLQNYRNFAVLNYGKDNTISELEIAAKMMLEVFKKAPEIKNSGNLNKRYYYFKYGNLVTSRNTKLNDSGPASTKYYSVASDTVIFHPSCTHVLMVFRCPHLRVDGYVDCKDNILEKNATFKYNGFLGTPGTFFNAETDVHKDGTPDYVAFAKRQFTESLKPLDDEYLAEITSLIFIGAQFNNYRDIRWYTSTNYVPALALQFVTRLKHNIFGDIIDLPYLKTVLGRRGICAPSYWVDLNIIKSIYTTHKKSFDIFDTPFEQETFDNFVQMPSHFVLDDENDQPRNKLMNENGLLKGLKDNQRVINFDSEINYESNDIAFDHVVNIMRAWSYVNSNNSVNLKKEED
ncbi:hypothetical protein HK100_004632 [Physocladia obscura]|uniref:Uncharacterized protein n=1 Tax=Physocladia obscura TaxID=109957 RepID=A0AAD5XCW0_9FUNG|nr:hypothetical protein HK100_004632 [Physocladia obscura]